MIDAPVSGSTAAAEQGDLVIMVGGEKEAYERARPILAVLGSEINYMGASGAGTTMKLVLNAFLGTGLQALAEAIALGEKAGLQKDQLLDVIGQTGVISPAYRGKLENARHDEYPVTFALRLMFKDFGLIMRQAAELSVPMPATAVAQQMCAAENAKGIEEDYSATIRLMEEIAASAPQLMASPSR
jgi:3-hydroxyisobutyrate dehydrogenase-like beta-hydroxyacid dehydrogenase